MSYKTGDDTLVASWDAFTVNGKDPYAYAKEQALWQDTPLTQMGLARLEKNGAIIERKKSGACMLLQTFPKQKVYVAMNPLPTYQVYNFQEPGGVKIVADGACSMGRWAIKNSREIDIKYCAFEKWAGAGSDWGKSTGGKPAELSDANQAPEAANRATCLFITGAKSKPQVTLNGKDVTGAIKPWKQAGADGWLVSLTGTFPADEQLTVRLGAKLAE